MSTIPAGYITILSTAEEREREEGQRGRRTWRRKPYQKQGNHCLRDFGCGFRLKVFSELRVAAEAVLTTALEEVKRAGGMRTDRTTTPTDL